MSASQMKDNNLLLEERKHVDENELATSEEWKLPYKSLRLDIYSVRRYFARNILNYCYDILPKNELFLRESLLGVPLEKRSSAF